ncbi:MAG: zinc metalloprotease HtpX [Candidatus Geothermarchaeales archaeon]
MRRIKLQLSIFGTLALIIGVSTLFFTVILTLLGLPNIFLIASFVIVFNLIQWLLAPKIIDAIYKVKEAGPEHSTLRDMVERLSHKMQLKTPRVMIANIAIPNAFAYGSPIAGSRVAVTTGLLKELEEEEVEAVVGHELGHLKHRDVQVMMFASVLPAIFYYIGYSFMLSGMFGGGRREGGAGGAVLIGLASMVLYWILTLFVLGLSRLREYYADYRSATTVEDGARKLSEALAKIVSSSSRRKITQRDVENLSSFKALFIEDPDRAVKSQAEIAQTGVFKTDQQLVQEVLSRRLTTADRLLELLSTHPNIVKRLRALRSIT